MHDLLPGVSIVGIGQIPVQKTSSASLREMGVTALRHAMDHGDQAKTGARNSTNAAFLS
jgi:hypothetical protein